MDSANDPSLGLDFDDFQDAANDAITTAQLVNQLTVQWQNESCAPDLLSHRSDIVELVLDQIQSMEGNLKAQPAKKNSVKHSVHRMELDRIVFLCNDYLRKRVAKIEKSAARLLKEDEVRTGRGEDARMSDQEKRYAQGFVRIQTDCFNRCVLDQLPNNPAIRDLDLSDLMPAANLDRHVFVEVTKAVDGVAVPDGNDPDSEVLLQLDTGSQHILPYKSVAQYLDEHLRLL